MEKLLQDTQDSTNMTNKTRNEYENIGFRFLYIEGA